MAIFYLYHPENFEENVPIIADGKEMHHVFRALRAGQGDRLVVFNGRGLVADVETSGPASPPRAQNPIPLIPRNIRRISPPKIPLHLLQGLTKGPAMEDVLRRSTELGVSAIYPVDCAFSAVHCPEERTDGRLDRWRRILLSACKQSHNPHMPLLHRPETLEKILKILPETTLRIVASLESSAICWSEFRKNFLPPPDGAVCLAVGPEGDFSPAEYALLRDHRFIPVRLGPRILTAETATLAAIAALQLEIGE